MAGSRALQTPFSKYTASISENFPQVIKSRLIETAIEYKEKIDVLPINITNDQRLSGNYIEFRINPLQGSFIDLTQLWLDLKLRLFKQNGEAILDTENVTVVDGLSNTIFKTVQVFLGDKLIESNPFYSYSSYIRMLTSFNNDDVNKYGLLGGLFPAKRTIPNHYKAGYFTNQSEDINNVQKLLKTEGYRLYFPLFLDVCTIDQYLLDGVSIRIRLELNTPSWVIHSDKTDINYNFQILESSLWLNRILPQVNALVALNKTFTQSIAYTYQRTLFKTYMIASNQTSLICEQPWNQIIPDKLYIIILDLDSYSGVQTKNPLYFQHGYMNSFQVYINGNNTNPIIANFPHDYSHIFGETLQAIGLTNKSLLNYNTFSSGRCIYCVDFNSEKLDSVLPLEKSGNLRIAFTFSEAVAYIRIVLFFAETLGVIYINPDRQLFTDSRA